VHTNAHGELTLETHIARLEKLIGRVQ
jgi:hypothetical protein